MRIDEGCLYATRINVGAVSGRALEMSDIDRILRRLGSAEPDRRVMDLDGAVMSRISLLSPVQQSGGILRWGSVTAVAALVVGAMMGNGLAVAAPPPRPSSPLYVGIALAPSTLLASAP